MSAEAVRTLKLNVIYNASSADAASKKHHAQEAARIKATAAEQAKADAAYERAILKHLTAEKQLEQQKLRGLRETAREQERVNREANALLRQSARDEEKLTRQVAAEKKKADRDAFREWKSGADQRHRETMAAFEAEKKEQAQFAEDMKRTGAAIGTLATGALAAFAAQFGKVREDAFHAAEDVMRMRGAVRELQALRDSMGQTGEGVAHVMKGAAQTLLTPEQFQQVEAAGLGVGELAIKNKADREQFEKAIVAAGRFAATEGGDAGAYGQMAGQIALQSKGPLDAAKMEAQMERLYQIQRPGGFRTMSQALGQYAGMNGYIQNGIYTPEEAMGLVSAFSVSSPEAAGSKAEQFTRAVMAGRVRSRGMATSKDMDMVKSADYFKGLGITEDDSAMARGRKIAADLAAQQAAAGKAGKKFNAAEYLMLHGIVNQEDALAIMDFAGLRNSGRLEKIEAAQRLKPAPGSVTRRFEEAARNDQFLRNRRQELTEQIQRTQTGVEEESLIEVQRAAFNRLRAQGKITGTFKEWKNKGTVQRILENSLYNGPNGWNLAPLGGYHNQVNVEAQRMLRAERRRLGLPQLGTFQMGGEEAAMARSAREIREHGGDPIRDAAEKLQKAAENLERATRRQSAPLVNMPMAHGNGVR